MVYLFMADGTEEVEAIAVLDVLRRGGVETLTVGVPEKTVCMSHGLRVECDAALRDLPENAAPEAVILPGGMPGTVNLENSKTVTRIVKDASASGAVVAAICAAPSILGHLGLLRGREAICYPGYEKELDGARISANPVVRDGNIITAKGAGVALEFGAKILEALKDRSTADKILSAIQFVI